MVCGPNAVRSRQTRPGANASAKLWPRQPPGIGHRLAMDRREPAVAQAGNPAAQSRGVLMRRRARKPSEKQPLLEAKGLHRPGHPRLAEGELLLHDHAREFLSIACARYWPGERHARNAMGYDLWCGHCQFERLDRCGRSMRKSLCFDHVETLAWPARRSASCGLTIEAARQKDRSSRRRERAPEGDDACDLQVGAKFNDVPALVDDLPAGVEDGDREPDPGAVLVKAARSNGSMTSIVSLEPRDLFENLPCALEVVSGPDDLGVFRPTDAQER